jgi:hypothetical protein
MLHGESHWKATIHIFSLKKFQKNIQNCYVHNSLPKNAILTLSLGPLEVNHPVTWPDHGLGLLWSQCMLSITCITDSLLISTTIYQDKSVSKIWHNKYTCQGKQLQSISNLDFSTKPPRRALF